LRYGIKAQPTIVVDGRVVFEGRPTADQMQALLAA
jgi:protein-disulfide isomerase